MLLATKLGNDILFQHSGLECHPESSYTPSFLLAIRARRNAVSLSGESRLDGIRLCITHKLCRAANTHPLYLSHHYHVLLRSVLSPLIQPTFLSHHVVKYLYWDHEGLPWRFF
jgi:hypothetical protein